MLTPCMGGWCHKREQCGAYHSPMRTSWTPSERQCRRGAEQPRPIVVVRRKAA